MGHEVKLLFEPSCSDSQWRELQGYVFLYTLILKRSVFEGEAERLEIYALT